MKPFKVLNATTVADASSKTKEGNSALLAGGTDLMNGLKAMIYAEPPENLINLKSIPDLEYIKEEGGTLKVGALTRLNSIAKSSIVNDKWKALAQAANRVASPELRNMGTIGGNICQENRCWYYRCEHNTFPCLRKNPSGLCYALSGDNRYHSIFGASNGCVAVNPSDVAIALVAFGAKIVTNQREVDAKDFFVATGKQINDLGEGEIVTEIHLPSPASGAKSAFVKHAIRKSFDFSLVSCAAVIGGGEASIVLGGVHNNPRIATAAQEAISGKAIDEQTATDAGEAAVEGATGLAHNSYKIQLTRVVVKRTILACQ